MKQIKFRSKRLAAWFDRWKWYHELAAILILIIVLTVLIKWRASL